MCIFIRKVCVCVFAAAILSACQRDQNHAEALKAFYTGLAAMQAANDQRAGEELNKAVSLANNEPAAWANLGILQMRQKDFDAAADSLEKAKNLAPKNAQIYTNIAVLEVQRGNFETAKQSLQKAIELNPNNPKAHYALAREYERQNDDAQAQAEYEDILQLKPGNLPTLLEVVRLAAKRNDSEKLRSVFAEIIPHTKSWDGEIKEQFDVLRTSVEAGNTRDVLRNTAFFRNVLLRLPEFRSEIDSVRYDDTFIGEPFQKPIILPTPNFEPAAPDETLSFKVEALTDNKAKWSKAVFLDGDAAPAVAWADEKQLHIGNEILPIINANDLQTIDLDYNFKNDFVVANDKGLGVFGDSFKDITAETKIPNDLLQKKYLKIFTFDIEIDGDLDLLAAADAGSPIVLQNNADGTFKQTNIFSEINGLREFMSFDVDEDGDMDAMAVDRGGKLLVFSNERGGQFRLRSSPVSAAVSAIASADLDGDGKLDLNILQEDGSLVRATDKNDGKEWVTAEILRGEASDLSLIVQDFDNNGANDVVVSNRIWLCDKDRNFTVSPASLNGKASSFVDFNGDGKLDAAGLDANGKPSKFINQSSKNYSWQIIRPRSAKAEGDQRVNSFGIGGEMEIRSGPAAQKQSISSPQIHFGLGEQTSVDLLRIIWGNGFVQAEFDLQRDQPILVQQRLTGSCPHLFVWNGTEFKFVKDSAPLGTSLGLKISNDEVLPVTQTEEWYKISGEQVAAKDGFYDLRITDELWESYYVDSYSLMVIDHRENTEIFVNEIYPIPSSLRFLTTSTQKPFARATDQKGNDVTGLIENLDEIYLDTFEKGTFQGVAKEHFVELELPPDAPRSEALNLIADGWLHPTDTSLNVAISQSGFEKPNSLSLDVADESGTWKTVKKDFGVPAGKLKTIVIELPQGTRRARLRTNAEIFWDKLAWATGVSETDNKVVRLDLSDAELRFRGFSVITKKDDSSPEIPDYNRIATTTQRWRGIAGYYTRYGDILELLMQTDDRYAIVSSGDEMVLRFAALPAVSEGFVRDFVIVGNGWIKEGDYNNVFSKTVLPLPTRTANDYTRPPTRLEDDPVYKKHKSDWPNFHTRYVASDVFRNALRK